ncbi:hypothetical protein DES53_104465 [Roseimicrobium gellanilyticum]|uniref:Uncharacterized protein n=1 Tax=Roseimicrobium gellanilyticum TaxID=748857 RepID=A0A366HNN2_9BACT|nr:hypothetical protein [Roseimicrobium gellanilyticum]RBP44643.1 hypothetical protein DES53_104465 [Roseimicrobium gellanilyticum]
MLSSTHSILSSCVPPRVTGLCCALLILGCDVVKGQGASSVGTASAKEASAVPPEELAKITAAREKDAGFDKLVRSIFADDGIADIRVTFGYDDTKDAREANDPIRAERFMNSLKELGFQEHAPSEAAAKALGVPVEAPNLRILSGQTKKGQMLRVALMWSALSKSGTKNIGIGYKEQLLRSGEAMDFTKKACAESEVMIYVGHSRSGGGPDTYPPETRPAAGGVSATDFSYYKKNRPGMQALGPYLRKRESTPKLVSWTGCLSDEHFRDWFAGCFAKKSHDTGVILSTRLTSYTPWENAVQGYDEGNMVAIAIIHALYEGSDRSAMEEKLRACEMHQLRDIDKPAWRLSLLPGARPQQNAIAAQGGATPPEGQGDGSVPAQAQVRAQAETKPALSPAGGQ